jgi:hypothetical protein
MEVKDEALPDLRADRRADFTGLPVRSFSFSQKYANFWVLRDNRP